MAIFKNPVTPRFKTLTIISFLWCFPAFAFAWVSQVGATSLWLDAASPLALASLHITMLIKDNKSPPRSNMISAWHSNIALALVYAIALVWGAGFLINLVESALLLKSDHDQGFGMGMLWSAILEILTSGAGNVLTWTFLLNTTMEQRQEARRQAYARPDMAERQAWNH